MYTSPQAKSLTLLVGLLLSLTVSGAAFAQSAEPAPTETAIEAPQEPVVAAPQDTALPPPEEAEPFNDELEETAREIAIHDQLAFQEQSVRDMPSSNLVEPEPVAPSASETPVADSNNADALFGGIILGLIVVALIALGATKALADYTSNRFGWPMILNWWNVLHLISIFALIGGLSVGAGAGGAVIAIGLWLIVLLVNVRKTNLLVGLTMTALQPFVVFIMWALYGVMKAKAEGRRV